MTHTQSTIEGFDTTLEGGIEVYIEFSRRTTFARDYHYGADADGRRGVVLDTIEEDEAEDVKVQFFDEAPLTPSPALKAEVDSAVERYIKSVQPTPEEPPEEDEDDDSEAW